VLAESVADKEEAGEEDESFPIRNDSKGKGKARMEEVE
jgi:hypothetical protein